MDKSDKDLISNLSWENNNYHHALFDLFTLIKCLKINDKMLNDAKINEDFFCRVMTTAEMILREENRN